MKRFCIIILLLTTSNFGNAQDNLQPNNVVDSLLNAEDYNGALSYIDKCLDTTNAENWKSYFYAVKSNIYFIQDDYEECISTSKKVIDLWGKPGVKQLYVMNSYINLYNSLKTLKEDKKAKEYLLSAPVGKLAIHDEVLSTIMNNIGFMLIKEYEFDRALKILNQSIVLDSRNAFAYNNRALISIEWEEYDIAKNDIEISLSINPDNPYVYYHKALLMIEQRKFDNACMELRMAQFKGIKKFSTDNNLKDDSDELIKTYCKF